MRLDDETIERIRRASEKKRWSLNQTIKHLLSDQLDFLDRCQSGEFRSSGNVDSFYTNPPSDVHELRLDRSDSQV